MRGKSWAIFTTGALPLEQLDKGRPMPQTDVRDKTEVWFVGRRETRLNRPTGYHIQGIATTETIAIEMCRDASYFIGPLPVNAALPHGRCDWPGMYFPLKGNHVPVH